MDNLMNKMADIATAYNKRDKLVDDVSKETETFSQEGNGDVKEPVSKEDVQEKQEQVEQVQEKDNVNSNKDEVESNKEVLQENQNEEEIKIHSDILKAYEEKSKSLEELVKYIEQLSDPMIYYQSEEDYKLHQLIKNNPNVPADVLKAAINDVNKMDNITLLRYGILLENPEIEGGIEGVNELIMEKYGIDDLEQDIPRSIKNKMAIDAKDVRGKLEKLASSVTVNRPQVVDEILKKITENKTQYENTLAAWKSKEVEIPNSIKIGDDFEFRFEQSFIDSVKEILPEYMTGKGVAPTDENAMDIVKSEVKAAYVVDNLERIAEAYAKYRVSKATEQLKSEYAGMVEQPKDNTAPADSTNDILNSIRQKAIKAGLISKK